MGSKDKAEIQSRVLHGEREFTPQLSDYCPLLPVFSAVLGHWEALWMGPMGLCPLCVLCASCYDRCPATLGSVYAALTLP